MGPVNQTARRLRAEQLRYGADLHAPEVESVGVPAGHPSRVTDRAILCVEAACLEKQSERSLVRVDEGASERSGQFGPAQAMPAIGLLVDSPRAVAEGEERDDLDSGWLGRPHERPS